MGYCASYAAYVRHDACLSGSSAWFSWLGAYNGPFWPYHIASWIASLAAPTVSLPCEGLATATRHTNQTAEQEPTDMRLYLSASSWHTILVANVTFFHHSCTILRKKAFLCCDEKHETTPININRAPTLPPWMQARSSESQPAYPACTHHDLP